MRNFSLHRLERKYRKRHPLSTYLAESMAAPEVKNAVFVARQRRPHPNVIVYSPLLPIMIIDSGDPDCRFFPCFIHCFPKPLRQRRPGDDLGRLEFCLKVAY
jgi:hypothetical protein